LEPNETTPNPETNGGESALPETPPANGNGVPRRRMRKRHIGLLVLVILVIVGAPMLYHFITYVQHHPSTDDAAVDGELYQVSPRIAGRVTKVYVTDNDVVREGQLLVDIDPGDIEKQLAEARAALATEQSNARAVGINVPIVATTTLSSRGQAAAALGASRAQTEAARHQVNVGHAQIASAGAGEDAARASVADTANTIASARAGLSSAQAALVSAEAGIKAAQDGVTAAQAGVQGADDSASVAASDVTAARATAKRAAADVKRSRNLFAQNAIPQSQLDVAEENATTSEARVAGAEKRHSAANASLAQAKANLSSAQNAQQQASARRDQAQAAIAQAQATYQSAQENANIMQARARQASASVKQAERGLQELQANVSQRQSGVAQAQAALRGTDAGPMQVQAAGEQANTTIARVQQAQARVEELLLQLSYTKIYAPHDGVVSQKNVNPGHAVTPGQPLMAVVDLAETFLTANYKETQLRHMRVGDQVKFTVDAYPGRDFVGHVESLSPGTGSVFALLPPENATGNFTKIVQRLPVRIAVDGGADETHPLRLGMSVVSVVTVQ
jgi:membrane fusion protein, multidrug efflux system